MMSSDMFTRFGSMSLTHEDSIDRVHLSERQTAFNFYRDKLEKEPYLPPISFFHVLNLFKNFV